MRRILAAILVASFMLTGLGQWSSPVAAVQEHDPEIVETLSMINTYRSWLGIPPLTIDPSLQKAAEAHIEYYRLNFGDPSLAGMGLHYETPGKPGFTGADFQDRADAAGYDGWVNENAGLSGSMVWSTEWFIGTVGHRLTLLDPRYSHIGLAAIDQGDIKFEIIDLGTPKWVEDTTPEWAAWPPAGTTGVGLSFDGEAPNPFPSASYPIGYPISLKYFGPGELTFSVATISTAGRAINSFAEIGTGWLSRETVLLCASEPLEMDTTYDVHIEGTANGQPFVKDWSFRTTNGDDELANSAQTVAPPPATPSPSPTPTPEPTPAPGAPVELLPAGLKATDPLVQGLWWETDGPVAQLQSQRSWLWGPDTWKAAGERYAEEADGSRQVYYFDKARMEVNERSGANKMVTAGLLVRDMIYGKAQVGDDQFVDAEPANVPLTGDPLEFNPDAPTYASLNGIASIETDRSVPARPGQPIVEVLWKDGSVGTNPSLGSIQYGSYEPTLGHNIAAVFDTYLQSLATDWHMSVGLPLAEPYWVRTNLAGQPTWVLVQAFERRILTYTPINRPEWRVEMGNVGRHYFTWRYGEEPPK
ncbi:MAG TPA: CAP domain-containing protein [Thermomicrobiales bacterium]|nr:CAP domain-containing protein [Thermomicrobiales bacterium]